MGERLEDNSISIRNKRRVVGKWGVGGGGFQNTSDHSSEWRAMNGEKVLKLFVYLGGMIKMAAAVAKAPEKSKVP